MNWQPSYDPAGGWHWQSVEFANGWTAVVSDHSQTYKPPQTTSYQAQAVCQWWIVSEPEPFATLTDAKAASLELALIQGVASSDPACRRERSAPCR